MDAINRLATLVGYTVVGGSLLIAIALQMFKHWSVKWLDAQFDERLQNLRHAHAQEIEGFRFKISTLLDRATKLHQREFDVLPEAWAKLSDAYWRATALVAPFKELPDLNRMSGPQREEFIAKSRLKEWQKAEVRTAADISAKYNEMNAWYILGDAKSACTDSSRYLGVQGIFVEPELRKKMDRLNQLNWNALIEDETNKQHDMRERDQAGALRNEGGPLREELESAIHRRIWPAAKVEP
jgi:hypothetical protein